MRKGLVVDLIIVLLVILFVYTSFSKIFDFNGFKIALQNQPLPKWLSKLLVWVIPGTELISAGMMFYNKTVKAGLLLASLLMLLFTFYVALILLNFFPNIPCSCGGAIQSLTWAEHFFFNLFFLILSCTGYLLSKRDVPIVAKNISRAKSG